MQGHHVVEIRDLEDARWQLEQIGASAEGIEYMRSKAVFRCIKLKNILVKAANLIKQEMLSKGGEAAVARHAANGEGKTDVLLMGTVRQYERLHEKLRLQPFGLSSLADEIMQLVAAQGRTTKRIQLANGKTFDLGKKTIIMGILNVTPDSFSDGGSYYQIEDAAQHALEMCQNGADIIDVGGASSRPNSIMVSEAEERRRVEPLVERLTKEGIIVSVDTFRAGVAEAVLAKGAHMINDIGSLQMDEGLLPVLLKYEAPVVIMHNRLQKNHNIPYKDLISDIIGELQEAIDLALDKGMSKDKIIIDPGIGFGKTPAQNRQLLKAMRDFTASRYPVLLGTSRKSFIGHTLDLEVDQRLEASMGTVAIGIMNGVDIVRVHDVKETKKMTMMMDAVLKENG
ncbi:MAG: dihydropteroate synthase [Bacillota bacterium]|nr:dihydropteroate synthase [Bacillota bacterium]